MYKERYVRTQFAERLSHFGLGYLLVVKALQAEHRYRGIGAAAAQASAGRQVLEEFDARSDSLPGQFFEGSYSFDHKVIFTGLDPVLDE